MRRAPARLTLPAVPDRAAELLQSVPLFAGLGRRDLQRLATTMKPRRFAVGEAIAREGERGAWFFVIEEGTARVTIGGDAVRELGPGDYFGEIALIAETDRTATVTSETEMRCYTLTNWEFRAIVESNPQIAWQFLEAVANMVQEADQREA